MVGTMTVLTELMEAMRALIDGGLRGEDRVKFIVRMRAHMISVAAYVLENQQTIFRDADVFLPEALAWYTKSPDRAEANAIESGFAQCDAAAEACHRDVHSQEEPAPSP
jgi:hypothetical protein